MGVHFGRAAFELAELAARVPEERLAGPGLGEWTLRELLGHASRAISTVRDSLADEAPRAATVRDAPAYLQLVLRQGDDAAIAARGRESAAALGDDIAGAIAALAEEASEAVEAAAPDRLVRVGAGGIAAMPLDEYLRTRVFELTVHGLDVADAAGLAWRPPPAHLQDALVLAACNATTRDRGLEALRLLTGRRPDAGLDGVLAAGG